MMETNHVAAGQPTAHSPLLAADLPPRHTPPTVPLREARLPFRIRVVNDDETLERALHIRQSAYQRHVPDFAKTMHEPESYDLEPGGIVLLAESKLGGNPVGTMRIQTNCYKPLAMEQSVRLPAWLGGRMVGATRLAVEAGEAGRTVKTALFKAFYLYCISQAIEWMVIAARTPLDRQYASLQFRDVFGVKEFIPLAHAANIPHRVMAFEVGTAEQRWRTSAHPLYDFMITTYHPDIDLSAAAPLDWAPAADARRAAARYLAEALQVTGTPA